MKNEFKTLDEVIRFLDDHKETINENGSDKLANIAIPIFASEMAENQEVMMEVIKWFYTESNKTYTEIIHHHFKELKDTSLSLYKFSVLCGIRGPSDKESFYDEIEKIVDHEYVSKIAKHKDFPMDLKQLFYDRYGDVEYLPQDAQDIFIF